MGELVEEQKLTSGQREAIDAAVTTRNALVDAREHLFRALGRPQPGRERKWAGRVWQELASAREALQQHRAEVESDEGLYGELKVDAPRLLPRVEQLKAQLARIITEADDLAAEVDRVRNGDPQSLATIRYDAERMLATLQDLIARENDIIFERFNEPPALD
jgi:hypothetical protein